MTNWRLNVSVGALVLLGGSIAYAHNKYTLYRMRKVNEEKKRLDEKVKKINERFFLLKCVGGALGVSLMAYAAIKVRDRVKG